MNSLLFNSIKICVNFVTKFKQKRCLSLGIIGAPTSVGQSKPGVELGPDTIRSSGLVELIERMGHDVIDFGNFHFNSVNNCFSDNNCNEVIINNKLKNEALVRQMFSELYSLVNKVILNNRIPITIGGDHSTAIASIAANGRHKANMSLLWIDAHADINTVKTTKSGHFHGMAVSFLIKQIQQIFDNPNENILPVNPCIDSNNMAFIGLRDVESSELELIERTGITYFTTQDIDKLGINEVIARSLDKINPKLKHKIHVSFDIDAMDPIWAPSTGTPVSGGLTLRESLCIGEEIFSTNMLCGLDLVEVNPKIGDQNDVKKTIDSALQIILSFLGKTRIGFYTKK